MKTIRSYKKARVQDYARAHGQNINHAVAGDVASGAATGAALGTIVPGVGNVVGGIIGAGGGLLKGLTSSSETKINKKDFYANRDKIYTRIGQIYGIGDPNKKSAYPDINDHPELQIFSHKAIKDSPFKNYKNEMASLIEVVTRIFPNALPEEGEIPVNKTSAPLESVMKKSILDSGKIPSKEFSKQEQFVNEIVGPATGKDFSGVGKEAIENAAIEFIATLVEKKRNGEILPPVYDKIARGAMGVEERVEKNVRAGVAGNIGEVIMNNPMIIIAGFILIIILMTHK